MHRSTCVLIGAPPGAAPTRTSNGSSRQRWRCACSVCRGAVALVRASVRRALARSAASAVFVASIAVVVAGSALAASVTVENCADSGAGSLRQAVVDAAAGDTIEFASSLVCPVITLTSGEILTDKDLAIAGPGATGLAVSGNGNRFPARRRRDPSRPSPRDGVDEHGVGQHRSRRRRWHPQRVPFLDDLDERPVRQHREARWRGLRERNHHDGVVEHRGRAPSPATSQPWAGAGESTMRSTRFRSARDTECRGRSSRMDATLPPRALR